MESGQRRNTVKLIGQDGDSYLIDLEDGTARVLDLCRKPKLLPVFPRAVLTTGRWWGPLPSGRENEMLELAERLMDVRPVIRRRRRWSRLVKAP